jgi:hypothetical protein
VLLSVFPAIISILRARKLSAPQAEGK